MSSTAFLDGGGQSRIVGIWDQRDSTGPAPDGFDFGTYHTRQQIAAYIATNAHAPAQNVVLPPNLAQRTLMGTAHMSPVLPQVASQGSSGRRCARGAAAHHHFFQR